MNLLEPVKAAAANAALQVQANPRLRWGVWAILGILWLYGVLLLRDGVEVKASEYREASSRVVRLRALASDTEWPSRLEKSRAALSELEGRLWREGTIGLAQASFTDWLNQVVQQASVGKSTVNVAAQENPAAVESSPSEASVAGGPPLQGLWKVSGRVSFDFDPNTAYPMIAKLVSSERAVIVESLIVRGAPNLRAEMVVVAYFQKPISAQGMAPGPMSGQGI